MHIALQFAAAALLVEITFWTFGKLPFTCSYFAGKTSLSLLVVIYLYGFTTYSFNMGDLEKASDTRIAIGLGGTVLALILLLGSWCRRSVGEEIMFDGFEPVIQTLDLF